jgi:hypothetical protein
MRFFFCDFRNETKLIESLVFSKKKKTTLLSSKFKLSSPVTTTRWERTEIFLKKKKREKELGLNSFFFFFFLIQGPSQIFRLKWENSENWSHRSFIQGHEFALAIHRSVGGCTSLFKALLIFCYIFKSGDPLTMDFDNFDNESLNRYKKYFKNNKKKFINVFFYFYIDGHSNFMQFHYRLIVHQRPLI